MGQLIISCRSSAVEQHMMYKSYLWVFEMLDWILFLSLNYGIETCGRRCEKMPNSCLEHFCARFGAFEKNCCKNKEAML